MSEVLCAYVNCPMKVEKKDVFCEIHLRMVMLKNSSPKDAAKKFDTDKVRMDLLSPIALAEIAKAFTVGEKKYGEHNWRSGFKWSRLLGALLRHTIAFMGGEDKDPETGLSHMAHAGATVMFILEHEVTHKDKDDRYKIKVEKESK